MVFHLAIPCKDINEACEFYRGLGALVGRKYDTHAILKFYDCQLVVHLSGKWDRDPVMYPRHFGIIVRHDFELFDLWNRWKYAKFVFEEHFVRQRGRLEEHHTFFLQDPSNNLIEFKWYKNRSAIFT